MTAPQIRAARPEDLNALARVIDAAYAPFTASLPGLPDMTDGLEEDIASHPVFVAETSEGIVAGMILIPATDHLKLANIAVMPDAAGKGVASALLARADAEARQLRLPVLRLATHVAMEANQRFYAKRGWRETGRDGHRVFMEKPV
ncbi:GNAT family N-acetyltransferase [Oceanibium sediminis]|uniref:GNAT family N-acetyltransferase n=1 Tax=Oceanibium sediminis TaxID=2026339 RepID=UPI000DD2D526|nr:GNAT family N-acetyltransferase [Oceanibium sediminis]